MNVWLSEDWRTNHEIDTYKGGLQCRFDSNCAGEVKKRAKGLHDGCGRVSISCKSFGIFSRQMIVLKPQMVNVFLLFFVEPYERSGHPHIYIAVGSYAEHKDKVGRTLL